MARWWLGSPWAPGAERACSSATRRAVRHTAASWSGPSARQRQGTCRCPEEERRTCLCHVCCGDTHVGKLHSKGKAEERFGRYSLDSYSVSMLQTVTQGDFLLKDVHRWGGGHVGIEPGTSRLRVEHLRRYNNHLTHLASKRSYSRTTVTVLSAALPEWGSGWAVGPGCPCRTRPIPPWPAHRPPGGQGPAGATRSTQHAQGQGHYYGSLLKRIQVKGETNRMLDSFTLRSLLSRITFSFHIWCPEKPRFGSLTIRPWNDTTGKRHKKHWQWNPAGLETSQLLSEERHTVGRSNNNALRELMNNEPPLWTKRNKKGIIYWPQLVVKQIQQQNSSTHKHTQTHTSCASMPGFHRQCTTVASVLPNKGLIRSQCRMPTWI